MKVPLKWLADYVPLEMPIPELCERITKAGLEVSGFRSVGVPQPEGMKVRPGENDLVWDRDKVFVAKVVSVEKHPNADKLKLPLVDLGNGKQMQLVTGATNINVGDSGQMVIVGLAGTVFWDGHVSPKKRTELKPKPVRGIPSEGMVMSALELGLSEEHEGIIILDEDAPVGAPLADFMGDVVLELDVLPNMARCHSMMGVAREVAALTGKTLKVPALPSQADGEKILGRVEVEIENTELSSRYAAGLIEGVVIRPSPGWMQRRLNLAGMRPINNIVDITNYVMLEWGQPLHAFDFDILKKRAGGRTPKIVIRPAREGERLTTLDGMERKLTPEMLIIADCQGPIALAGIMGGLETEVTEKTENILLESANFNFLNIRKTMRNLDLPSEASLRFSRGVHPGLVPTALARASDLMRQFAGGKIAQGIVDLYPNPPKAQMVHLNKDEIRRVLGMEIPLAECKRLLETLEFKVKQIGDDTLEAVVPDHRLDIQVGPADLIEDLIRLYGYEKLPETRLGEELPDWLDTRSIDFEEEVKDHLVARGLQEVITYALLDPAREKLLGITPREYITLLNPISSERTALRQTLLAGILEIAASNLRQCSSLALFEIGTVYWSIPGQKMPSEPRQLVLVLSGKRDSDHWENLDTRPLQNYDFYDLKGCLEGLFQDLHLSAHEFVPATHPFLHPGKSAEVKHRGQVLACLGELHPRVAESFGLGATPVQVAEVYLEPLLAALPVRHPYLSFSRYPAALRDIAVIVPEETPAVVVEKEIRSGGGDLIQAVRLFDVYRGDSIPTGTKSLAYSLGYQASDRTLSDKEVEKAHKGVENRLRHVLKARIRGQDT